MKVSKYIIFIFCMLLFGINNVVFADTIEHHFYRGSNGDNLELIYDKTTGAESMKVNGKEVKNFGTTEVDTAYFKGHKERPTVIVYINIGYGNKYYLFSEKEKNDEYKDSVFFDETNTQKVTFEHTNSSSEEVEYKFDETCYYYDNNRRVFMQLILNSNKPAKSTVIINGMEGFKPRKFPNKEKILNWGHTSSYVDIQSGDRIDINAYNGDSCPPSLSVATVGIFNAFEVFADYPYTADNIYTAQLQPNATHDSYQLALLGVESGEQNPLSPAETIDCSFFGEITDAGKVEYENGIIINEEPPSLAYLIHKALSIARIIAILLVITLGIVDFAKAAIAGKEDEMKKHQKTFIKRIIICVAIFLVPVIVDIIMKLLDIAMKDGMLGVQCDNMLK